MNETCTDCGAPATCRYDWGAGMRYGCAGHDPLRWPFGATMARVPPYYCSLPFFPVLATTGHLSAAGYWLPPQTVGMTPPERMAIGITPPEAVAYGGSRT
jgi:hypothetical protein